MTLSATVRMMPDTKVRSYDYEHKESTVGRIVGVAFDGLDIYIGLDGGDQEKIAALDVLIGSLSTLRDNARNRQNWDRARYAVEEAELAKRDGLNDAGLGTGYIGEFR